MEKKMFTIAVFTENQVGLLNRISIIFTRRGINLESVSSSPSAEAGVHKMNFLVAGEREVLEKVVKQIEKCVDVLKAFLYTDDEIVYQEVALYKVPTVRLLDEPNLERIIRVHNARILEITRDYTVIEKTGHETETQALYDLLTQYGIQQFIRSGRISVTKSPTEHFTRFLEEQEARRRNIEGV
ncbi:MAG: acetolactate synthase small subunit [Duncaniella sp.]|jgi:acetolactate synthase-1/3 small subunit|uniref:acetolactate synthase small subunit n=1 Tax=Duncaniella muricolitica TaxID=2880704 RepID=UPI000F48E2DB|nr:acetolactate synthase small subunit [Duncaniella muricolitica]MCX4368813.1 acetolactate synthase small subunit [Duncaniella sp.]MDE5693910.1 acetolactate synthase small subunit [Duncaniella sp.]MDE6206124.1 acetolactate synthase small subunit [Duncaniella sp.]ROT19675.1 acetolactate synthase small subunit [Muribaculaceae bacterium Isolate-110 (HZI)]